MMTNIIKLLYLSLKLSLLKRLNKIRGWYYVLISLKYKLIYFSRCVIIEVKYLLSIIKLMLVVFIIYATNKLKTKLKRCYYE